MKRHTSLGTGTASTAEPIPPAATAMTGGPPWAALQRGIGGTVVLPDDPRYETVRTLNWRQFDTVKPQAVVRCVSAEDVAEAVRFARRYAIPAVARSGGHSFAGYSTTTGMVIDVSPMDKVRMAGPLARVQAGAQLIDVEEALSPLGVAVPTGWCPTVGIGGLTLGGGLGFFTRMYGVTSDRMRRARVVLADGRIVDSDEHSHPDLFWGLRGGGGGNFGIVTEFDFEPVPTRDMTTFTLTWAWASARAVLAAWQPWMAEAPDPLTPLLNISQQGPDLASEPTVTVSGVWLGPPAQIGPLLDRLTALVGADPTSSDRRTDSYRDGMRHWFNFCRSNLKPAQLHRLGHSPEARLPRYGFVLLRGNYFDKPFDAAGIDEVLAAFASHRNSEDIRDFGLQALGGAHNRVSPSATAYVHRDALFYAGWTVGIDVPDGEVLAPDRERAARQWIGQSCSRVRPRSSGQTYQNYIDPDLADWRRAYYGANYERLTAVKHAYDPEGFFSFPQAIGDECASV